MWPPRSTAPVTLPRPRPMRDHSSRPARPPGRLGPIARGAYLPFPAGRRTGRQAGTQTNGTDALQRIVARCSPEQLEGVGRNQRPIGAGLTTGLYRLDDADIVPAPS